MSQNVDYATGELITTNGEVLTQQTETVTNLDKIVGVIENLKNGGTNVYSSIKSDDFKSKLDVTRALTSSKSWEELGGKPIELVNYIVQSVEVTNQETEKPEFAPRVILIDKNGNAYHATSFGVLSSLNVIVSVVGKPESWDEPVKVKFVVEKTAKNRKVTTLQVV